MGRSSASTVAGRRRAGTPKPASRRKPAARKRAPAPKRTKPAKTAPRGRLKARKPARPRRTAAKAKQRRGLPSIGLRQTGWRARGLILLVVLLAAAGGYMFWFRDSSLVAINDVEVVGATSGEGPAVVEELTRASEGMSTLNVDRDRLEQVATSFVTIAAVDIDPNFPHGLRLELTERPPAILVASGEKAEDAVPVAADGTVLAGVPVPEDNNLPLLDLGGSLAGGDLEGEALEKALVAGAAPEPLRALIGNVEEDKDFGIVATLEGGMPVRFGTPDGLAAKWAAAAAVLADPKLDYASYVDVRVPGRPVAGDAATPVEEL